MPPAVGEARFSSTCGRGPSRSRTSLIAEAGYPSYDWDALSGAVVEEHRADTDAEGAGTRHDDDASDLRDRLGRLERVVAGMAAEATVRGGESGEPAATEAPETVETAEAPEADTEVIPAIEREPEPEPEPPVTHDGTATPRRTRGRRVGWVLAGTCACCAVVLAGTLIGGGSAPPWMSIPGVTENNDEDDPANSSPRPASSVSGAPDGGPGERAVPAPGNPTRSGEAPEPSAGARSGGSGSPDPAPTPTDAVSPSATSGSPSAPETTTPQSPTAGTGTPTPSDEPTDPPPEDTDPLGGLLGGLFGG